MSLSSISCKTASQCLASGQLEDLGNCYSSRDVSANYKSGSTSEAPSQLESLLVDEIIARFRLPLSYAGSRQFFLTVTCAVVGKAVKFLSKVAIFKDSLGRLVVR